MKIKYNIGIWGQFGGEGHVLADGQAVRTTIIYEELRKHYGEDTIAIVNTHNWKQNPITFLFKSIKLIMLSRNFLFLPADNGFKVFAPILVLLNMFLHRNLIYIVIGGFLPDLLKKNKWYISVVKRMSHLFVQTLSLKQELNELGITHVKILSNLKRLNTIRQDEISVNENKYIELCVFSRLIKEKGIEDAIEAVKLANNALGGLYITLDMYGVVPEYYKRDFDKLLHENERFVKYRGILRYDKTVETLHNYFALLFPTYYYGEGLPGNIVDAYNSALPIIATDWKYNSDVIINNHNGLLVPPQNPYKLSKSILYLYNHRNIAYDMRLNNLKAAEIYNPDVVLSDLYDNLIIKN